MLAADIQDAVFLVFILLPVKYKLQVFYSKQVDHQHPNITVTNSIGD